MPFDLNPLAEISGFVAGCIAERETGQLIDQTDTDTLDLAAAAAGMAALMRERQQSLVDLRLDAGSEDLLITLSGQYHLVQELPRWPGRILVVALDRARADPTAARQQVARLAHAWKG